MNEQALIFDSQGYALTGIVHPAEAATGVLLVVGGPQYRVGSHRQFVLLARDLASSGWPVMRFDYRGMGDSSGANVDFEHCGDDIRSAVDEFFHQAPQLQRVVIWGLCDAASAACFYAPGDDRVAGLVLLNPWVRTEEGEAKAMLRHYYLKRLISADFWKKLLRGGVSVGGAVSDLGGQVKSATQQAPSTDAPLPERMRQGLQAFARPRLFILSGNDLVADEFRDRVRNDRQWLQETEGALAEKQQLDAANHTFSRAEWRQQVSEWTIDWLRRQMP